MLDRARATVPWSAYACLAASMALVGSYVGLSKVLVGVFPVLLLAWLRFGIAALAMLPWLAPERSSATAVSAPTPLGVAEHRLLFLQSLLGNFLFSLCMMTGVALTSAVAAGVVMAALPVAVALLSRVFLGDRIRHGVALGIVCAALGIGLMALPGDASTAPTAMGPPGLGHVLLLAAVLCEASYVVIGKRLSGRLSPKRLSALINLWGLALATPLGLWAARDYDFTAVSASLWAALVVYAIAASMITVWLWMTGLRHVPASDAGVFTVMLPLGAAAIGVLALGEPFEARHGVALALALAGIASATWRRGAASSLTA